ncbi:acetyl-CoA carboxylase biotin carboxylase subunit [Variovorax sp. J22P271]|uniref:acetyl/propionyl/methylcrotonyl-CoA carboxylase subunit alpha n=1 Tax=Variovorax davisae TaxID=3053515 RepID=UPI00257688EF|nr:acetyl-CoA carboxylase biotin carboxylase subunit [Variovorax sp. J22P271]MDM0030601.1 acetyl-CoA carboxylase biotin carboxylase subunit [Variovorax sp. J22P271]
MTAPTLSTPSATPFHKVLVANRGEIALRVIRSARAMGYRTVAVYSTADAGARHVQEADQAVCIGEPLPAQSYLRIPAIVEAAKLSGADAVHPGYGFLAENEDFAQACKDAGLVFIGPSAEAIVAMGHKAGAKTLMQAAGVPCIPGYQGEDQGEARLADEAARIGFPVMIKATAGGGGRGMRLVPSAKEFPELLRSARSEAQSAFGDPEVILERAIVEPRHIEIQIFADRHGNAIHLGERDCSVQRRHQKLIEEAPSPAVDAALRERMGATAVAAVKAIRYEGAGTLEFLLDREGNFYFMEMNTRLQVEHPVTEAVTGLDLVELQLRVAAGEPLPLTQAQVRFEGHAIEVRLCAEDADQGFMPQSGTVALWKMPAQLRVEDALRSGAEIPPYYDSMIAKIISHGRTRDEARRKLAAGLEDAVALGVTTNQAFLRSCLAHPVFAAGGATTAFIGQHQDALLAEDEALQARAAALAAVLLYETTGERRQRAAGRRLSHNLPISLRFDIGGKVQNASVTLPRQHHFEVALGERSVAIEGVAIAADSVRFTCDGLQEQATWFRDGATLLLQYRGLALRIEDKTRAASARQGESGGDGKLRASMNGRVVAVLATVGDMVEAGQPIVTLEAMKMEHVHAAPVAGRLTAVHVSNGEQVAASRVVAEIEVVAAAAA